MINIIIFIIINIFLYLVHCHAQAAKEGQTNKRIPADVLECSPIISISHQTNQNVFQNIKKTKFKNTNVFHLNQSVIQHTSAVIWYQVSLMSKSKGFLVSQFFFFIFLNCFYRLSKVEKHFYHLKALHDDSIIKLGVFMHLQCRGINDGFGFLNLIQWWFSFSLSKIGRVLDTFWPSINQTFGAANLFPLFESVFQSVTDCNCTDSYTDWGNRCWIRSTKLSFKFFFVIIILRHAWRSPDRF